jgi:hypothetical protein
MATYPIDIPALPPLDSGVNDNPAAAIVQGELVHGGHVAAAADQHQNRKRLLECTPPLATQNEVFDSKRRKHTVQSISFDAGANVPPWALAIHGTLLQQQDTLHQQQDTLNQQQERLQRISRELQRESQRSMNRSRKSNAETIEKVVRVEDGHMPNPPMWFPADQNALMIASVIQIEALLQFYGQDPIGLKAQKQIQLKNFLGVN